MERHEDRTRQTQDMHHVRAEMQSLQSGLSQQLQASVESLHMAQVNQGFLELKQLLLAQSGKRPRKGEDCL